MESLKKIEAACRKFEEAAIKHAEATETGNYAQANKSYQVIVPIFERNAMQILQSIASGNNIHSLTAKMTIDEWGKGTLIL